MVGRKEVLERQASSVQHRSSSNQAFNSFLPACLNSFLCVSVKLGSSDTKHPAILSQDRTGRLDAWKAVGSTHSSGWGESQGQGRLPEYILGPSGYTVSSVLSVWAGTSVTGFRRQDYTQPGLDPAPHQGLVSVI